MSNDDRSWRHDWMTAEEMTEYLGISRRTLRRRVSNGKVEKKGEHNSTRYRLPSDNEENTQGVGHDPGQNDRGVGHDPGQNDRGVGQNGEGVGQIPAENGEGGRQNGEGVGQNVQGTPDNVQGVSDNLRQNDGGTSDNLRQNDGGTSDNLRQTSDNPGQNGTGGTGNPGQNQTDELPFDVYDTGSILETIVEDGLRPIDSTEAIEHFAQLSLESPDIWRDIKRSVRTCVKKECPDLKVTMADDWAGRVQEKAARLEASEQEEGGTVFELGSEAEISRHLEAEVTDGDPLVYDYGEFHKYDPQAGLWRPIAEETLSSTLQEYDGATIVENPENPKNLKISKSKVDGAIGLFRDRVDESATTENDESFFDRAPRGLMFRNAFLRVEGDELVPEEPDPGHRARIGADVVYDPEAEAPQFEEYLDSIFEGDEDAEDKQKLLLEFAGGCLFQLATSFERVLMLYDATDTSSGANGKSVFIKLLSRAFPRSATSQVSPQQFDERFAVAALAGARVNYVTELPESDIIVSDKLKGVITGDPMMAEQKYGDPWWFRPKAGHIFAANDLPRVRATDDAFWRRWMVLPFGNRFTPPGEPGLDRIRNLDEKIAQNEMAGVLARMVEGARRLLKQGGYTIPKSAERAKRRWRMFSNPIEQFLIDETKNYSRRGPTYDTDGKWWIDERSRTSASKLYEAYTDWCDATGHRACSKIKFGRRVSKLIDKNRTSSDRFYRVRLKDERKRIGDRVKTDF